MIPSHTILASTFALYIPTETLSLQSPSLSHLSSPRRPSFVLQLSNDRLTFWPQEENYQPTPTETTKKSINFDDPNFQWSAKKENPSSSSSPSLLRLRGASGLASFQLRSEDFQFKWAEAMAGLGKEEKPWEEKVEEFPAGLMETVGAKEFRPRNNFLSRQDFPQSFSAPPQSPSEQPNPARSPSVEFSPSNSSFPRESSRRWKFSSIRLEADERGEISPDRKNPRLTPEAPANEQTMSPPYRQRRWWEILLSRCCGFCEGETKSQPKASQEMHQMVHSTIPQDAPSQAPVAVPSRLNIPEPNVSISMLNSYHSMPGHSPSPVPESFVPSRSRSPFEEQKNRRPQPKDGELSDIEL